MAEQNNQESGLRDSLATQLASECRMFCSKPNGINPKDSYVWENGSTRLYVYVGDGVVAFFSDKLYSKPLRKFELCSPNSIDEIRDYIRKRGRE